MIAGVHFFLPLGFCHQKPRGDEREYLMMVPALPVANLVRRARRQARRSARSPTGSTFGALADRLDVVGQARFALGTLEAFFDAMLGFGRAGELHGVSLCSGVGQVVVGLVDASGITFSETDHDQDFYVTFLPLAGARDHATRDHLDDERALRAVAHIDLGPDAFVDRANPRVAAC